MTVGTSISTAEDYNPLAFGGDFLFAIDEFSCNAAI
jgi:hypothetical protein